MHTGLGQDSDILTVCVWTSPCRIRRVYHHPAKMNMVKRIMGRPRQEECSPQDNALGLMHLRRLFTELCHPPRHMTQKEQEEKLYMMLPVFNRVSPGCHAPGFRMGWLCRNLEITISHVVELLSCVQLFATPWTAARQAPLSSTTSRSLLKLMSVEAVMLSNHLILCCPLLFLPSVFPSFKVFSSELAFLIRWPKYWNLRFSTSPSSEFECSGLISCRIDWIHLPAAQGTLKSLH